MRQEDDSLWSGYDDNPRSSDRGVKLTSGVDSFDSARAEWLRNQTTEIPKRWESYDLNRHFPESKQQVHAAAALRACQSVSQQLLSGALFDLRAV